MYLRKTKSLNKLLYHLFRLMPENPAFAETAVELSNKDPRTFFTEELQLGIIGQYDVCVYFFPGTRLNSGCMTLYHEDMESNPKCGSPL